MNIALYILTVYWHFVLGVALLAGQIAEMLATSMIAVLLIVGPIALVIVCIQELYDKWVVYQLRKHFSSNKN